MLGSQSIPVPKRLPHEWKAIRCCLSRPIIFVVVLRLSVASFSSFFPSLLENFLCGVLNLFSGCVCGLPVGEKKNMASSVFPTYDTSFCDVWSVAPVLVYALGVRGRGLGSRLSGKQASTVRFLESLGDGGGVYRACIRSNIFSGGGSIMTVLYLGGFISRLCFGCADSRYFAARDSALLV